MSEEGSRRSKPRYARIDRGRCEILHEAALSILERTGVRLLLPRAVDLLRQAGAPVSDGDRVRIPRELVDHALRTVPHSFTLYDRSGSPALSLDGARTYYGPGSDCLNVLDHRSGERRAPTLDDVREGIRVCNGLAHVDYVMSLFLPGDVDPRTADRHQMHAMLTQSDKPIVFVTYDASGCYDAVAMAEAAAGGSQALSERPFLACYINTTTGLLHNADALEKLLFLAERRLPTLYIPGSQAGVSSPATAAGSVATVWVGVLTGLVLSQLAREGAPFVAKGWGGGGLDMRTMVYGYASPDTRATAVTLARFCDLPVFALAGASDAKRVDQQAALEAALTLSVETLAGADLVHDMGYLESGMTGSLAQLTICDEIVDWLEHLAAEIDTSAEALALDLIDEIGPDGQFLATEHTRAHFREHWYPRIIERDTHEVWLSRGSTTLAERSAARVAELLEANPERPSPAYDDQLATIVREAQTRVSRTR